MAASMTAAATDPPWQGLASSSQAVLRHETAACRMRLAEVQQACLCILRSSVADEQLTSLMLDLQLGRVRPCCSCILWDTVKHASL